MRGGVEGVVGVEGEVGEDGVGGDVGKAELEAEEGEVCG